MLFRSDIPLEDVTLTITQLSGAPVTDVLGNAVTTTTTDATGYYTFDNLPIGTYVVTVTNFEGADPTLANVGSDTAVDSSTDSETSVALPTDGDRDPTLDFGFWAPQVSVGNYVWFDMNHDGLQDATDVPIEGVTLTLTYVKIGRAHV